MAAAGAGGLTWWRGHNLGAVQRGYEIASARGCFACHGPGGATGFTGTDAAIGSVPTFAPDDVREYARDGAEIREWILDGMPRRLRAEAGGAEPAIFRMPAWRGLLSEREVDDLVAYVEAVSDFETPSDPRAEEGRLTAARLGCFTCHGPQGRGNPRNPRSLKGYVPSWDGADFPELAQDDAEVQEWILDGSPRRLRAHPIAAFFLNRQMLQMPAYRGKIQDEDLARLLDYIRWLRASRK